MSQNKTGLGAFYTDQSSLTYEGDNYTGLKQIGEKLQSLGFQNVFHYFQYLSIKGNLELQINGLPTISSRRRHSYFRYWKYDYGRRDHF